MDWQPRTFSQTLAAAAQRWPRQEAVVVGDSRLTYEELWARTRVVAANLKRLGVRRGDHMAICMGNSAEWVTLLYAAATLGAVTVPVNTRFKADELKYCLEQADVTLLVIADRFLKIDFIDMLRRICPGIDDRLPDAALPLLRNLIVHGSDVPVGALSFGELQQTATGLPDAHSENVGIDDVVLIQYTSGSTSFPKGVMLTHANMLHDAWHVSRRLGLQPGERYFSARPLFHVAGTTLSVLTSLQAGTCYVSTPTFDAESALRVMAAERCTHTCGNDTLFFMMMNHPNFSHYPLHLRGGWAAASSSVMTQIRERMGVDELCAAYGLSESSPNVSMSRHDDVLEKRLLGFAHPLPGLEVRIVDAASGGDQPAGATGEILVRGWSVMKGYYKMPEQTARAIDTDGWLHTGDLGVMDADGRLCFVGRAKELFRVGGENVAPAEVEDVLHRHPAIKQAQVIGVPDPRLVEVAAAYVLLNENRRASPEEIIDWCRERCASFKVPRYVRIVESFEPIGMTGSGKVQKNKLREYALDDLGLRRKAV
jgi:fatty-acyl-CoA synthase